MNCLRYRNFAEVLNLHIRDEMPENDLIHPHLNLLRLRRKANFKAANLPSPLQSLRDYTSLYLISLLHGQWVLQSDLARSNSILRS